MFLYFLCCPITFICEVKLHIYLTYNDFYNAKLFKLFILNAKITFDNKFFKQKHHISLIKLDLYGVN